MIVKLHISIVVRVLPNLLSLLKVMCRLPIPNSEIMMMYNQIISKEQFRRRIPMDSDFPCIHRMNHLIQVDTPTLDISSSDYNPPDPVKKQLDVPFEEPN